MHPDLSRLSLAPTGAGQASKIQKTDQEIFNEIARLVIRQMQNLDTMERRVDQLLSIMLTSPGLRDAADAKVGELERRMIVKFTQDPASFTKRDRTRNLLETDPVANHALVVYQIKHTLRVLEGLGATKMAQGEILVEVLPQGAQSSIPMAHLHSPAPSVDQRVVELAAEFEDKLLTVTADWYRDADARAAGWEAQLEYEVRQAEEPKEVQAAVELWKALREEEELLTEELRRAYKAKNAAIVDHCGCDALDVATADGLEHIESAHNARCAALEEAGEELEAKMQEVDSDDEVGQIEYYQQKARDRRALEEMALK